ncbi:bifunctional UDP-3-O-[3-hydroxymyristoyl] N-acetylglucosamine deacetylase/3-hydroxyacyl-ACP dehydratase [Candidatus Marinimicrobia bacterium]|nr:bifunctional UDP-3-O-[3-hydroxymyristoyl] N-acetylglucosamine deacetylase/3-hydroxyacyl-ACP dehydratase [Candidatus Neomarinimicrobiota bacterium]
MIASKIVFQNTINDEISFEGIGLHTGINCLLKLIPASVNSGINFYLQSGNKNIKIPALIDNVSTTVRGTNLTKNEYTISTVEHLLSALYSLKITNLDIKISASELPILDGSSKLFLNAINNIGIKKQSKKINQFIVNEIISFKSTDGIQFYLIPSNKQKFTYNLRYKNVEALNQTFTLTLEDDNYEKQVSGSKTFCLLSELIYLYKNNLIKGGSLDNALVYIDKKINSSEIKKLNNYFKCEIKINYSDNILNNVDLKYKNEAARHKIIDLIGDISLLGIDIKGHIIAEKSGHKSNIEFAKYIKKFFLNKNLKKEKSMYNIDQILKIMPHRYPFLLVDKVLHLESGKSVSAIKNVTINEPFFNGHFPSKPVMPGVLLLEVMAQAGGFLVLHSIDEPENKFIYLSSIKSAKFKSIVQPGDQLLIKARLDKFKMGTCKISSKIYVDNKLITECELLASVVNRDK